MKKLIILGDSLFAQIAYEYFTHDSDYQVVGFAVEHQFLKHESIFGLPISPLEDLEKVYAPNGHHFFAAIPYTQLNRLRKRLYLETKARGYKPASYVSSKSFVWRNIKMGEHCFIFEDNTIQPFVTLGDNIVLWSGNHIGHHSTLQSHSFISSHVVISGNVRVGESCFFGVNSTVINDLEIANETLVGAGALVTRSTTQGSMIKGGVGQVSNSSAYDFFQVKAEP